MAATNGQTIDPLIEPLERQPFAFDLFQALRLLQCRHATRPRIGLSERPEDDPVRFGQSPSIAFAPAAIDRWVQRSEDQPPKLLVHCFGLLGANGPLPLCWTEYALERQLNFKDPTVAAFLDVFHHRLISLFFRAWAVTRKTVDADLPEQGRFPDYIGSLLGLGLPALRNRDEIGDWPKLFYSGWLSSQVRPPEGLEAILQDYFNLPVQIEPFVGRWLSLPQDSRCRLGASPDTGRLGCSLIVGSQFWDCQMTFGIRLGPMTLADYERLLPGGRAFERLQAWVAAYTGREFLCKVTFVLAAAEIPVTRLGAAGRVGRTTWLKSRAFDRAAADFVVQLE